MSKYDVVVVGTIFVDIKGFPQGSYDPRGRNIGNVQFFHGGVGRNVAETIAQLNVHTAFSSTVDTSALGQEVLERLQVMHIDTTYVQQEKEGMGMWLAIIDESGDLAGSISQMPSPDIMEAAILQAAPSFLEESKAVALEIDLTETIAETIVHEAIKRQVPIYGIPGNLEVIQKRKDLLQHVQCFICNDVEAHKLTSYSTETEGDIRKAAAAFISMGIKQIVITLGERGSFYLDSQTQEEGFIPASKVEVVDTTGAGDSFFAGTVAALIRGASLEQAVHQGTQVAAITISSPESTSRSLKEKLERII